MKILILGTHPHAHMPSMELYADWLAGACATEFETQLYKPAPIFFNRVTRRWKIGKWLKYLDIYVIAPLWLAVVQGRYDFIIAADHGNAPALSLVRHEKAVSMMHDAIAIHAAFYPDANIYGTGSSGRALQKWIVHALKRCRLLFANPGPLTQQLRDLGITSPIVVLGNPFEPKRMAAEVGDTDLPAEFYLNVGSDDLRKRKKDLLRLWQAFEAVDSETWLILAGKTKDDTRRLIEELGLKRVKVLNFVSDAILAELYRRCSGLVVASSLEGFCIPVLEALAANKPVFTPKDTPFFTEVFGDAVQPCLTFDAAGAQSLFEAGHASPSAAFEMARAQLLETYGWPNFCRLVTTSLRSLKTAI
jgi:glycosyltransferase involved in cell wall biosynthesis